jgi:hypothetical protein
VTDFPDLKLKALVSFPAAILDGAGIDVVKQNGSFQFNIAFDDFAPPVGGISDPAHQNALLWNSITNAYVLAPISLIGSGGAVPEAPNDGVQYARQSLAWTPVTAGGGGTPSNTNPIMDGVAAPGVATAYSRGDHVHPSDTSRAAVSYVDAQDALRAPLASPAFTGNPTAPTPSPGDSDTSIATTAFVAAAIASGGTFVDAPSDGSSYGRLNAAWAKVAPLNSPLLTGDPRAPTPSPGDNDTSIATTAFVAAAVAAGGGGGPSPSNANPLVNGAAAPGVSALYSRGDHVHPTDATRAPLASPVFTGDPQAPTPTAGDNDTSIATTAFVQAALGLPIRVIRVQVFAASGTYAPNANMVFCIMETVAGGGGGGSANTPTPASSLFSGGGGASGGYSRKLVAKATVGASQPVTIGAAGVGGPSGSNAGGTGGQTSVGSLCVANGGGGGAYGAVASVGIGGNPGVPGTGDIASPGAPGTGGFYNNANNIITTPSGDGGSSVFGGGGAGNSGGTGATATGYGAGGAGGTATAAGGNGSAGVVIITEFCSQ